MVYAPNGLITQHRILQYLNSQHLSSLKFLYTLFQLKLMRY